MTARPNRNAWLGYVVAAVVIAVDQAVKAWILGGAGLSEGASADLWGPFRLTLVWNPGVAYGLFRSDSAWPRWALCAFEFAVAVALAVWVRRAEKPWTGLAIGLVIGGAVGNLIDRVRFGAVVDFIDARGLALPLHWHFPWIFNVADAAITAGVIGLIAESVLSPRKPGR